MSSFLMGPYIRRFVTVSNKSTPRGSKITVDHAFHPTTEENSMNAIPMPMDRLCARFQSKRCFKVEHSGKQLVIYPSCDPLFASAVGRADKANDISSSFDS